MQGIHSSDEAVHAVWAKSDPYHPLWCHMPDAAATCEHLASRFRLPAGLSLSWVPYLVALHDIGKADPLFQDKCDTRAGVKPGEMKIYRIATS
jgi:hypothetical protein